MNFINHIRHPIKTTKKMIQIIENFYYRNKYNYNFFYNKQVANFYELGFDREKSLNSLLKLKKKINFPKREMSSEHEIIFSAISEKKNVKKILEIGTFDGMNAYLLSHLFPSAEITTIDLATDDETFSKTYNRQSNLTEFLKKRNDILDRCKNIIFKEMNSINLPGLDKKFDLIWVDGAHGFPIVTMDISNSLKLINDDGFIICDDVFTIKPENEDEMYVSIAAYETLKIMQSENLIKFKLLFKRLDKKFNANPNLRQHIAFCKKN